MKKNKLWQVAICFVLILSMCFPLFAGCSPTQSSSFHVGTTAPADDVGQAGDFYFNKATSELFYKTDAWEKVADLKGQQGQPGEQGQTGEQGVGITDVELVDGEIIVTLSNGEEINVGPLPTDEPQQPEFSETDARNAFYAKMKEKAASFGIDTSRLTFNSAISESSGSITSRDMAKMGVMAMGYDELVKIWNQRKYTFTTSEVVKTITVESTFMEGDYGHYLSDHYYVLGGKTGSLAKTSAGTPVTCIVVAVKGPNDATFVGFISGKFRDTDSQNRFRLAKTAFDIASQKYLDKNADTSALEETLPSDCMITILSLPQTGNLLSYNYYDWYAEDSPYLVYDKNGTMPYYTASSWKILTCMTALDYIADLDETLTITESCIKSGSGPVFDGGEVITYRDALHLILLPSSNTTCVAIAAAVGQKILQHESSVSGGPVYSPVGEGDFDFDTAPVVSVAEAKSNPDTGMPVKVRGVVIGATNTYDNSTNTVMLIKDEQSNEICGVAKALTTKSAFETNLPFEIGDIVEIPVICEVVPGNFSYGGEHNKLTFTWFGDRFDSTDPTPFVTKYRVGHTDNFAIDKEQVTTVIDSQEDLEAFCNRESGLHWEIVILRGTTEQPLKAVTGAATASGKKDKDMKREYIRIFFDNPTSIDEQKVGKTSPCLSNFGNLHNLPDLLSTMIFNQTEYAQEDFTQPYTFVGDVYCLVIGGSTAYYHFVVPDASCIVPA